MSVLSATAPLLEHCLTVFLDLNDIGNVPYSLARPFLLKIESPEKLVSGSSCLHIVGSIG